MADPQNFLKILRLARWRKKNGFTKNRVKNKEKRRAKTVRLKT